MVDVSCEYVQSSIVIQVKMTVMTSSTTNPHNPIPLYDINTTFPSPTVEVDTKGVGKRCTVISIDHLPTLVSLNLPFLPYLSDNLLAAPRSIRAILERSPPFPSSITRTFPSSSMGERGETLPSKDGGSTY